MRELVSGMGIELLEIIGSAIGTVVFTLGGFLVEQAGLQNVLTGQTTLGVWEAGIGILFLFIGTYMFGYQELWPRLQVLARSNLE